MVRHPLGLAAATVAVLAALALALAGGMGTGTARASGGLGASACNLLTDAGAPQLVGGDAGYPSSAQTVLNACFVRACWQPYTDPDSGVQKCHDGRAAILTLGRTKTSKQALNFVHRALQRGYGRVKIKGADLAGYVGNVKGGGLIMAVGRTTVLFGLGDYSDNDPNPQWGYDPREVMFPEARRIARDLRRPGCPSNPGKCS